MCLASDPPVDNSAKIAREQEQERQARIRSGQESIDEAFSFFGPDYYDQYQGDYLGYYRPQIDKQFGDAKQDLRYDFARKGTLNSTAATDKFSDLIDAYRTRTDEIGSNALSATSALRGQVEQNKANLYQQNTTAADPSLAAQSAAGSAGSLMTPPVYSPLADLFSGFLNSGASYVAGRQQALPAGYAQAFRPGASTVSNPAYRVVT